jgi:IS1 transposase
VHVQLLASTHDVTIHRLAAGADAIGSYVGTKANTPWIWIAMDTKTRQVIAFHVGDCSPDNARNLATLTATRFNPVIKAFCQRLASPSPSGS